MRSEEAREKFDEADRLYSAGQYAQALAILDDLDEAFPNKKNVLFPRARCLAHLNRIDEAMALCDRLIEEFNSKRARGLRARLENVQIAALGASGPKAAAMAGPTAASIPTRPGVAGVVVPDLGLGQAPKHKLPAPEPESRFLTFMKGYGLAVGIGLLVVVLVLGGALFLPKPTEEDLAKQEAANSQTQDETDGLLSGVDVVRIVFVLEIVSTSIAVFLTLLLFDHWPQDTLAGNIVHIVGGVAGTILACWITGYLFKSNFVVRVVWCGALSGIFQLNFWAIIVVWLIRTGIFVAAVVLGILHFGNII